MTEPQTITIDGHELRVPVIKLACLLLQFEQDEPYKEDEVICDMEITPGVFNAHLTYPCSGDAPITCIHCVAKEAIRKAEWIIGKLGEAGE